MSSAINKITQHPLTAGFGVELRGVDLAGCLSDDVMRLLSRCLVDHKVVVLRGQELTVEQYARFGRRWTGETRIDGFEEMTVSGFRDINIVGNVGELYKDAGYRNGAAFWHTDCAAEADANATTMLYCIHALPENGETVLADMESAYTHLPDALKEKIRGLSGWHCYSGAKPVLGGRESWEFPLTPVSEKTAATFPDPVLKPLVRAHSVTGKAGLYAPAGSMFSIEGMGDAEADALMRQLKAHATDKQFCYSHAYRPGDLVFWDNSCTMHYATPTEAATGAHDKRMMHRICPLGLPRFL